ncbi:uncharacterized protein LOC126779895 isoform X2 [Nymphalis io]|uniref:uncharacterized protein LOC126779895 isoform X2 n=1 Tax=Inachis io TaxID=171585 RepID=UPI00216A6FF1|nr:uncharacterized protein LOC126779895 isoform X2 [Nymphalis io]
MLYCVYTQRRKAENIAYFVRLKMNSKVYKWCVVPLCKNTSISTPNKLFVYVPNKKIVRSKWLKLARRNPGDVSTNSSIYICEDHFDLPNDMENYMQYHLMGSVSRVRMKPGCIPRKFDCQTDCKTRISTEAERPYITKTRKMMVLEECEKLLKEDTPLEAPECSASQQNPLKLQDKTFERLKAVSRTKSHVCITDQETEDTISPLANYDSNTSEEVTARDDPLSNLQGQSLGANENITSMASTFAQSDLKDSFDDVISSACKLSGLYNNVTPSSSRINDFHNNKILEYRIKLENEIGNEVMEPEHPLFQVNVEMDQDGDILVKDEIKVEAECLQCNICLSVGRKMYAIDKYAYIYKKLLYDNYEEQYNNTFDTTLVCWECNALLRNVEKFQNKIKKANEMLQTQKNIISLSSLTTVVISDSNLETIYLTGENTEHRLNTENGDVIKNDVISDGATDVNDGCVEENPLENSSNLKTVRNKWAKRRVMLNREPKFKKVQDHDVFEKVSFNIRILQDVIQECRNNESYKSNEFKCLSCVRRFDNRNALIEHNYQNHDERIGPYLCDVCRSRFTDVHTLSSHLLSHYYMYYCKLCDYKCYNENDTVSHARAQHGSKAYECLKCDRLFNNRREFYEHHKLRHETYICDYCGVKYKLRDSLITHIRKKHMKRECTICKKKFNRYNSLWLHNKLYHGAPAGTAYCVECDVRYEDTYRYKWHLANSVKHRPKKVVRAIPPSPYVSSPDEEHDLLMENECLDGSHKVSSSQSLANVINIINQEKDFISEIRPEEDTGNEDELNKENSEAEKIISAVGRTSEDYSKGKRIRERDFCFYCETFILNFSRHMVRKHISEPEVQLALSHPKSSVERKRSFSELRKRGNFVRNSKVCFKPVKKCRLSEKNDYLPCSKCLGFYHRKQLWRHIKQCKNDNSTSNAQVEAQFFRTSR